MNKINNLKNSGQPHASHQFVLPALLSTSDSVVPTDYLLSLQASYHLQKALSVVSFVCPLGLEPSVELLPPD